MANVILRPRVFVTILVWVVSFCGLLMVWQAPPPLSTSSLLHPSSSSVGSEDSDQEFLFHRNRNKLVPRTHVSNWAYLQPKPRERTDSWKERVDPWKEQTDSWKENADSLKERLDSWKERVDPWKEQTDSWKENADSLKERLDSWKESSDSPKEKLDSWKEKTVPLRERTEPSARAKPYSKISFRNGESSTRKSLGVSGDGGHLPMSSPITYHRSRIKDATPRGTNALSSLPPDDREERMPLVHHTKMEIKAAPSRTTKENDEYTPVSYSDNGEAEKSTEVKPMKPAADDVISSSYGLRSDHEEDEGEEYYDEEYVDNGENDGGEGKERVIDEVGYPNDEYGDTEAVDLGGRFNVTPPDASVVIYNRVPKCASSTMQTILRRLSKHLNFEHVSSLIYDHHQLTRDEQEKLVENLTTSLTAAPSHALSYDRHLYYTNFTGLGMNPPVYINIVRDPVERFISSFYYRRSEERLNRIQMHGHSVSPSLSWVNRTVEQCVLLNDPECSFVPGEEKELMLSYFCGHQKFCRIIGNRDSVQMAKHIVSKEYSVVGLVEHMDLSLLLLETLVPRFMEGATEIYGNIRQKEHMVVNINHKKPKVSLAVREELLRRMSDDVDFYYFLEQRLFEQRKNFLSKR